MLPTRHEPLEFRSSLKGKSLPVYGEGKNVRDWLYVEDHASAIWAIMTHAGKTCNVGGGDRAERVERRVEIRRGKTSTVRQTNSMSPEYLFMIRKDSPQQSAQWSGFLRTFIEFPPADS